ncbi:MAG: hypothetical protein KatS3mg054_0032 [Chloroflexus sp.]|nr:MAG: hypothetical protein KatS3mg054_0032 [Chloroflexus sp.]
MIVAFSLYHLCGELYRLRNKNKAEVLAQIATLIENSEQEVMDLIDMNLFMTPPDDYVSGSDLLFDLISIKPTNQMSAIASLAWGAMWSSTQKSPYMFRGDNDVKHRAINLIAQLLSSINCSPGKAVKTAHQLDALKSSLPIPDHHG